MANTIQSHDSVNCDGQGTTIVEGEKILIPEVCSLIGKESLGKPLAVVPWLERHQMNHNIVG